MTIEEGYGAVSKAIFGIAPGDFIPCGTCTRCKVPLRFSPANGNCQLDCHFHFGRRDREKLTIVYNGAWVKFEWDADLCDQCLGSLSDWLLGDGWRHKECGQGSS